MNQVVAAACALALTGLAFAGPNEDSLIATDKAFADMARTQGAAKAYAAYAAPNAKMFDDGEGIVTGIGDIEKILEAEYAEGGTVTWTPSEAVSSNDGTMGYTMGAWVYTTAESPEQSGYYLTVWRKQKDGTWKFAVDADTTEQDAD